MITFRLGLHQLNENRAKELVEAINRNPGSCDTVWLTSIGYYPSLKRHTEYADGWVKSAKIFRDAGLKVSFHIANTFGHGDAFQASPENKDVFSEGMQNTRDNPFMVGPTGVQNKSCFCWNSESFREYIKSLTRIYCERLQPYRLWLDDDLRADNHPPNCHTCYCDRCISKFNKLNNTNFTRETLVHEINYGNIEYRKKYIEFCRQGIYDFVYEVARAGCEVTKDLRLGLEYWHNSHYLGKDDDYILKAMFDASNHPVETRPGCLNYTDKSPWGQFVKSLDISISNSLLPDYVESCDAEIENLTLGAYGKSIGGIVNEGTLYLATGCTGLTFTDVQSCNEPMSFYEKTFAKYSAFRPYWTRLAEISKTCFRSGVSVFWGEQPHLRKISENQELFSWSYILRDSDINFLRIGIPITYDQRKPSAYLLHYKTIDGMTDNDIRFLLTQPVITDGESIAKLCQRGFGKYFDFRITPMSDATFEKFNECTVNGNYSGNFFKKCYATPPVKMYSFSSLNENSEVIGEAYNDLFLTDEKYVGPCDLITTIQNNGKKSVKWAIFGYCIWDDLICSSKRNQIVNALDEIALMPAKLIGEEQASIIPSVDKDGKTVAVTISSVSQNGTNEMKLVVRNPRSNRFETMGTRHTNPIANCVKFDNDEMTISVAPLDPYEIITIFF